MRVTLRSRITLIMIIFVVVLVSAFTFVQLQNQLRVITIFNSLKARLTAQILKDALQKVLRETPAENIICQQISASSAQWLYSD